MWKNLGPLTLADIMQNSSYEPNFYNDLIEFKTTQFDKYTVQGQFSKGTDSAEGIVRRILNDGGINEGLYSLNKLNGYGR